MQHFNPQSPNFSGVVSAGVSAGVSGTAEPVDVSPAKIFDFANIAHCWSLSESEQRDLLGSVPVEMFERWRLGLFQGFTPATGRRLACLFDIFALLQLTFREAETADGWVRKPNYDLHGRTPLSIMMQGIDGLNAVRAHLQQQV